MNEENFWLMNHVPVFLAMDFKNHKKGAYQAPNKKEKRDFIRKYLAKFDQ